MHIDQKILIDEARNSKLIDMQKLNWNICDINYEQILY